MLAHSALISLTVQDGELAGSSRALLCAPRASLGPAQGSLVSPHQKGVCVRPVPAVRHG